MSDATDSPVVAAPTGVVPTPIGATSAVVRRTTGVAGIAFFALGAVATVLRLLAPGNNASGSQVELYVIQHYHVQQVSLVVGAAALFAFVIFAGHLSARIRRADAAVGDSWAPSYLIGATGVVILGLAAAAAQGGYQELAHQAALPIEVLDVYHVFTGLASASVLALAAMLVSIGLSGLLNGTIPVPLSWLALVTAVVGIVAAGGIGTSRTTFGILVVIADFLWLAWTLGVSVWLLAAEDRQRPGS
ncbi:MAG: hypothetical protein ACYCZV_06690 [Acidimicrobiales bacterium]